MSYCDPIELKRLILSAQATGVVSEILIKMGGEIGFNLRSKYKFCYITPEDAYSIGCNVVMSVFKTYRDGKGSAFNYLTTCILNEMRMIWRTEENYVNLKRRNTVRHREKQEQEIRQNQSRVCR